MARRRRRGSKPPVGHSVQVTGRVQEFRPGGDGNNLTSTQITATNSFSGAFSVLNSGNARPAARVIDTGFLPPSLIAPKLGAAGNVESWGHVLNPGTYSMDFYESLEGMRVAMPSARVVGATNQFGEVSLVAQAQVGAPGSVWTPPGGVSLAPGQFNGQRLFIDDVIKGTPVVNVGAQLSNISGVMDYWFNNYKLLLTQSATATTALLRTALNERGHDKARALMAMETTLRELESFGLTRDPENYALALYGKPGEGGWGWRIEGHHLSLHFSLDADRYVATLPQFFGANPTIVPRGVAVGPRAGFRLLGSEEDTTRQWVTSLREVQRQVAVIDKWPYGDILSRNAPRAKPLDDVGLAFADMNATQQALLLKLLATFADHLQPELAQAHLARVRSAPLDAVRMAWAGSTVPREPHYFRIQGSSFLIEFDNSGSNHIHSVWRDFEGDFGRDVLREH